jgi:hypothetical protein
MKKLIPGVTIVSCCLDCLCDADWQVEAVCLLRSPCLLFNLLLPVAVEDCMWAQFIAATRGSDAGTDDSSLHPLHDLMNHSDTSNCAAGVSTEQEGWVTHASAGALSVRNHYTVYITGMDLTNLQQVCNTPSHHNPAGLASALLVYC